MKLLSYKQKSCDGKEKKNDEQNRRQAEVI